MFVETDCSQQSTRYRTIWNLNWNWKLWKEIEIEFCGRDFFRPHKQFSKAFLLCKVFFPIHNQIKLKPKDYKLEQITPPTICPLLNRVPNRAARKCWANTFTALPVLPVHLKVAQKACKLVLFSWGLPRKEMYQLGVVIYKKIKPLTFFGAGFGCGGGKAFCCCQSQGSAIAYPANALSSSSPSTTHLRRQNSNSLQWFLA